MLSGNQRVERGRERREVEQLARTREVARLVQAVDPHAGEPELRARLDVVVQRRRDVDVGSRSAVVVRKNVFQCAKAGL